MKYVVLCVALLFGQINGQDTDQKKTGLTDADSLQLYRTIFENDGENTPSEEKRNGEILINYELPQPKVYDDYLVYDLMGDSELKWPPVSVLSEDDLMGNNDYGDTELLGFVNDYNLQPNDNQDTLHYDFQEDNAPFINFDGGFGDNGQMADSEDLEDSNQNAMESFINLLRPKSFNVYALTQYFIIANPEKKEEESEESLKVFESPELVDSSYQRMSHIRLAGPLIMLSILITISSAMLLIFYLAKRRSHQLEVTENNGAYKHLREDV